MFDFMHDVSFEAAKIMGIFGLFVICLIGLVLIALIWSDILEF